MSLITFSLIFAAALLFFIAAIVTTARGPLHSAAFGAIALAAALDRFP